MFCDESGEWRARHFVLSPLTLSLKRKKNEELLGVIPLNQIKVFFSLSFYLFNCIIFSFNCIKVSYLIICKDNDN
jgi:hypothetical protein